MDEKIERTEGETMQYVIQDLIFQYEKECHKIRIERSGEFVDWIDLEGVFLGGVFKDPFDYIELCEDWIKANNAL